MSLQKLRFKKMLKRKNLRKKKSSKKSRINLKQLSRWKSVMLILKRSVMKTSHKLNIKKMKNYSRLLSFLGNHQNLWGKFSRKSTR